ncbi:single-stranded DNA-binding protein [Kribbella sandramycini]|uniref:Single-stranded DNA-binding protein n=1 Tax=Kribbella sandramycini TaxID=60450 RepID=A0A7Y4KVX2_9ACTN|nr:single-stranded DNA-binding protein [Kribbella sandramycini]MBB6567855.1 single-strand DNA-binding protein [Kribbella sandramycini]NOL39550.1 single-stranded DNA-binding protein [Kribbella sandramycini]
MSLGDTHVTVQGWVGSAPQFKEIGGRTPRTTFRVGSTPKHFDRGLNAWADRPTTWFAVECWRALAQNTFESVQLGQPILVSGWLRTREWTEEGGEKRSRVVLEAISIGHDLSRGTTSFTKSKPRAEPAWRSLPPAGDAAPPSTAAASSEPAGSPGLVVPYPPDEFTTVPLPLTPTTEAA